MISTIHTATLLGSLLFAELSLSKNVTRTVDDMFEGDGQISLGWVGGWIIGQYCYGEHRFLMCMAQGQLLTGV